MPGHPTLLIVSHRPEALGRADRILVLRNGTVEAYGTFAELLPVNDEVQAIWSGRESGNSAPAS